MWSNILFIKKVWCYICFLCFQSLEFSDHGSAIPNTNVYFTQNWALKRKCHHFDEIFITGCTESCQNDNFQCSQWRKFRQNDDISVSVRMIRSERYICLLLSNFCGYLFWSNQACINKHPVHKHGHFTYFFSLIKKHHWISLSYTVKPLIQEAYLVGNKIVDHSNVFGAASTTTFSFLT